MIGIIVPLAQEATVFKKEKLKTKEAIKISDNLLLFISGIGAENVSNAVSILESKVSHLISWGTAGALSKSLKPGNLLLPDLILDKTNLQFPTDTDFKNQLLKQLPNEQLVENGLLAESHTILKNQKEKLAFQIQSNAVACDMESATIAKLANKKGIPFNAIRFIADDVSTLIPRSVSESINKDGDFSILKFLGQIITHPNDVSKVYHLSKNFDQAKKTMIILKEILLKL